MLSTLHIENIAVIEAADIEFHAGFNVLTGETGAGKSIVIDAIGAMLGARTSRDLVRTGSTRAHVSGVFTEVGGALADALSALGAAPDEDGSLILSREIGVDGRSAGRINGRPVTVATLREAGSLLVNIHGQHDSQRLLNEATHLGFLDRFADSAPLLARYREAFETLLAIDKSIKALRMDDAEKARRVDALRFQIDQLEKAALKPGEEESLLARRSALHSAEKRSRAVQRALGSLFGDEEVSGACASAREAAEALSACAEDDGEMRALYERLEEAQSVLADIAGEVLALSGGAVYDEQELDAIEGRLDLLARLGKRYGGTVDEMIAHLASCRRELDDIEYAEDRLRTLSVRRREAKYSALEAARALSTHREEAARALSGRITEELRYLDMGKARFEVAVTRTGEDGRARLTREGIDRAVFLITVNAGEVAKPLSRVASGGELARVMLALQNVLAAFDDVQTMIFDEVDAGVSGKAAQRVAEKLAQVSRQRQVLCVTHSTQLGAMADTHFLIEKGEAGGRVRTRVTPLALDARAAELARIISGAEVTVAATANAAELLAAARRYKGSLDGTKDFVSD